MEAIPFLAKQLCPDIEKDVIPLDRKPRLIQQCGEMAAGLLEKGFDRILIIWDLYPAWREGGENPCRREDRAAIFRALEKAGVDQAKVEAQVGLVCIQEELEAWLIADGRALSSVLSTAAHAVKIRHVRNAEQMRNPKKALNRKFKEHIGRQYSDRFHAIQIVRALPDLKRLRRLEQTGQEPGNRWPMETG